MELLLRGYLRSASVTLKADEIPLSERCEKLSALMQEESLDDVERAARMSSFLADLLEVLTALMAEMQEPNVPECLRRSVSLEERIARLRPIVALIPSEAAKPGGGERVEPASSSEPAVVAVPHHPSVSRGGGASSVSSTSPLRREKMAASSTGRNKKMTVTPEKTAGRGASPSSDSECRPVSSSTGGRPSPKQASSGGLFRSPPSAAAVAICRAAHLGCSPVDLSTRKPPLQSLA